MPRDSQHPFHGSGVGGPGEGRDTRFHGSGGSGHVPGPRAVPDLAPVRPSFRGGRRLRGLVRGRRRVAAAGLAVAAAALAAWIPRGERAGSAHAEAGREPPPGPPAAESRPHASRPAGGRERAATVSAPVRIADAASARLLHPGDRVDVIAGEGGTRRARVVARNARVDRVPRSVETGPAGAAEDGALVVLRVPRGTATALAGAGAAGRLAVTLC